MISIKTAEATPVVLAKTAQRQEREQDQGCNDASWWRAMEQALISQWLAGGPIEQGSHLLIRAAGGLAAAQSRGDLTGGQTAVSTARQRAPGDVLSVTPRSDDDESGNGSRSPGSNEAGPGAFPPRFRSLSQARPAFTSQQAAGHQAVSSGQAQAQESLKAPEAIHEATAASDISAIGRSRAATDDPSSLFEWCSANHSEPFTASYLIPSASGVRAEPSAIHDSSGLPVQVIVKSAATGIATIAARPVTRAPTGLPSTSLLQSSTFAHDGAAEVEEPSPQRARLAARVGRETGSPESIIVRATFETLASHSPPQQGTTAGIRVWLGIDQSARPLLATVMAQIERLARSNGLQIHEWVCNGESVELHGLPSDSAGPDQLLPVERLSS